MFIVLVCMHIKMHCSLVYTYYVILYISYYIRIVYSFVFILSIQVLAAENQ